MKLILSAVLFISGCSDFNRWSHSETTIDCYAGSAKVFTYKSSSRVKINQHGHIELHDDVKSVTAQTNCIVIETR